ncbi:alpha-galactosidase [Pararcticibacter amylolyticus]|nr:alpha-galactosidase [Pararcticibacter amylolyticus]
MGLISIAECSVARDSTQIITETKSNALVFRVGEDRKLYQSYLGGKLANREEYQKIGRRRNQVYIPAGTDNLFEPAIRLVHNDGNPSLELEYADATSNRNGDIISTSIRLKDPRYPVEVLLHIEGYYNEDVFRYWTEIRHQEKKPIPLSNFASCMLHFDAPHYWLTQFHGDWASEMKMKESELTSGIKIIDSKLGTRTQMYQTPVFFLSLNKPATENSGELIAGTLEWTGNFQFAFEVDELNSLRVIAGMNPYASEYWLKPGENFVTPAFTFAYSNAGKGNASRKIHDWARNFGVLDGTKPRMTLLNNWEATFFDFDEQKLSQLFSFASELGTDLFLLDDGWFGNKYPRDNDRQGLGDWQENITKLPHGLGHLVKDAGSKGVKFGIWLEPEMVNPKSELYKKHPDWILKVPNREEHYYRNQLVLDLVNPEVQDFIYDLVDGLLTKYPGIAYIKWDCNRMMTNTYSPYLKNKQTHVYIEYVRSLYKVFDRIRAKYPHLPMMLCSGGGGRTDYGALKYFTEFWPSDNTDGLERVYMQWGYSYFFPSLALSSHVTSWGKQSLKFRTDVAMMGRLGYDIDVSHLSSADIRFSQEAIKNYKRLSSIIWQGDLYRLVSPYEENRAVLMYVSKDKSQSVVFSYNLNTRYAETFNKVALEGLDPRKNYKVEEINLLPDAKSAYPDNGKTYSGDYLMKNGLELSLNSALTSAVFEITEI